MRVSLVTRFRAACRDFMRGIKQKQRAKQSGILTAKQAKHAKI